MELLAKYQNGNLVTKLYSDGTRVRFTKEDEFKPEFAENVDVHISSRCDNGCQMCYANCTPDGVYGDLFNWKFLKSLHAGTEMALNLNFPLHPKIFEFLKMLKDKGVIANATVNQNHFEKNRIVIDQLYDQGLIYGLGISLTNATPEFVEAVQNYPNAIIHVINGVLTEEQVQVLADNGLKILILGYKNIGRGTSYLSMNKEEVEKNKEYLYKALKDLLPRFKVVSFDNLALEQLDVRRLLTDEEWEKFYGGDDGTFTFFLNLVDGYFAKNSLSPVHYPIGNKTMNEMFDVIRSISE